MDKLQHLKQFILRKIENEPDAWVSKSLQSVLNEIYEMEKTPSIRQGEDKQ